jgi:hypothetical protein
MGPISAKELETQICNVGEDLICWDVFGFKVIPFRHKVLFPIYSN